LGGFGVVLATGGAGVFFDGVSPIMITSESSVGTEIKEILNEMVHGPGAA
jgi:hypothetical protein